MQEIEKLKTLQTEREALKSRTKQKETEKKAENHTETVCPECGKPMRKRTAKSGPKADQPFWGCTGFPECKGTREVEA